MIRLLHEQEKELLMNYLKQETIVNYFILQGLEREKWEVMFEKKWGEFDDQGKLKALLLKRKTGNLQFYSREDFDIRGFCHLFKKEGFQKLIGEESIIRSFENHYPFSYIEKNAYLSRLDQRNKLPELSGSMNVHKVQIEDIDRIIPLYEKVFKGFTSRSMMIEKYEQGTGRGYYIEEDGKLVGVAQTAYEEKDSAVIVGVGTDPDYQKKGYATQCMTRLCHELLGEGKILYLQYDNQEAGSIYRRLGFEDIGRMISYYN